MIGADLKGFDLLAELGEDDREALVEVLEERKVSASVPLFREGSEAEGLVLIAKGEVEVRSSRTDSTFRAGPGRCLGALSLLVIGKRETSAVAIEPVTYWLLPRTSYRRLVDDAPRTACRLTEAIAIEAASSMRDGLDALSENP
ncbi:MAG: cyclic nucleotide-binding domain-containing protein [Myxococcota bacterium]